ncbi:MAG: hypothetical protein EZS28_024538 [Streblomastix strix]|uniref:MIF4G domain-containing protein n=1 Tax=Streblomastix strix TaxID=222440 RepID=A0A5J4VBU5_9EUKA|nr:MAG: hypothetical protein EZS28_024538 [Streblomastix strix]
MEKFVRMLYEKGVYEEKFTRLHAELSAVLIEQLKEIDEQEEIEKELNKEKFRIYMKAGENDKEVEENDDEDEVNEEEEEDEDDDDEDDDEEEHEFEEKKKRMIYLYKRLYKAPQRSVILAQLLKRRVKNEFNEEREISKQMALKEKEKKFEKEKEKEKQLEKEQQYKQKEEDKNEDEDARLERLKKLKEEEDQEELHKVRVKGNVIFVGELINCGVINAKEGSSFLSALWEGTTPESPNEMNMEALALFFTSVGEHIQYHYKENMEKNMNSIQNVIAGGHLSTRIKFKLQDVLDFYKNGWPKRIASNAYQDPSKQFMIADEKERKENEHIEKILKLLNKVTLDTINTLAEELFQLIISERFYSGQQSSFRRKILNKCQKYFEKNMKFFITEEDKQKSNQAEIEKQEQLFQESKKRNIRFVGMLLNNGLINMDVSQNIITILFEGSNPDYPDQDNMGSLAIFLDLIGQILSDAYM